MSVGPYRGKSLVAAQPPVVEAREHFYVETAYDEYNYEDADGVFVSESHPYRALRERRFIDSDNHSHEIGRAHAPEWADQIVAALNVHVPDDRTAEVSS